MKVRILKKEGEHVIETDFRHVIRIEETDVSLVIESKEDWEDITHKYEFPINDIFHIYEINVVLK